MNKKPIAIIAPNFDRHAALERIAGLDRKALARVEGAVYYPYFRFAATCRVPGLFSKRDLGAHCLVDGRRGIGATTVAFETIEEAVSDGEVLGALLSAEAARNAAQRFMTHAISRRTRTIARFGVELSHCGVVYKRFWLVRGGQHRFVVDSVTGQLHDIRLAAA